MSPRLHAVADSGELREDQPSLAEALLINERLEAELSGYRLRYANLQREVRNLQGTEPEAESVVFVLDYWAKRVVEEGWWSRLPTFRPGSQRWSAARGRLKEDWIPAQLCEAVEGALMQPKKQVKRAWVDATSIFRNEENTSRHYEHAMDPELDLVGAKERSLVIPHGLSTPYAEWFWKTCDCGHRGGEHSLPLPNGNGFRPCTDYDCDCPDWCDVIQTIEQWKRDKGLAA